MGTPRHPCPTGGDLPCRQDKQQKATCTSWPLTPRKQAGQTSLVTKTAAALAKGPAKSTGSPGRVE